MVTGNALSETSWLNQRSAKCVEFCCRICQVNQLFVSGVEQDGRAIDP